jgi:hypothetical protein
VSAVKRGIPAETIAGARSWQSRAQTAFTLGIGAADCLTQRCHVQLAFATGQQYGEPHSPCDPCGALMASWDTRPVGNTGYFRLPALHLSTDLKWPQAVPGARTPADAAALQIAVPA